MCLHFTLHGITPVTPLYYSCNTWYYSPPAIPTSIQLICDHHNIGITINITLNMRHIRILVLVLQIILDRQNIGITITTNIQPSEY